MDQSRTIARRSNSNLTPALLLLPREKRNAMLALYAFCREVDDVADDESRPVEQRRMLLDERRTDIRRACEKGRPELTANQEFLPIIQRFNLPFHLFDEVIRGCEMDLTITQYATYEDLELYCHRVASVVGLLSIEIFGYTSPATRDYAISLGKALQLTNILRDVWNDAQRGRIYLPQSELARYGVPPEEVLSGTFSARFIELAKSVAQRARYHYGMAQKLLPPGDRRNMVAAELMGTVYWRLLLKIERAHFDVLDPTPIRLSKVEKLTLVGWSWLAFAMHLPGARYGLPLEVSRE
jgi:phytoene synthase